MTATMEPSLTDGASSIPKWHKRLFQRSSRRSPPEKCGNRYGRAAALSAAADADGITRKRIGDRQPHRGQIHAESAASRSRRS